MVEVTNKSDVFEIQKQMEKRKAKLKAFFSVPIESRVIGQTISEGIFETLVVEKYENEV